MRSWWLGALLVGCGGGGKDPGTDGTTDTGTPEPTVTTDDDRDDDGHAPPADCDDQDPTIHPGAVEVPYDGVDQDCADGDLVDVDQDGSDAIEAGGDDCDDGDPAVRPGATDTVGNGVDDDCDGTDGVDADRDGAAARASGGEDCDDTDPAVLPGAEEVWYDGVDQDCARDCDWDADGDGAVQPGFVAADGGPCDLDPAPGVVLAPEDCDEADPLATFQAVAASSPRGGAQGVDPSAVITATLTTPDPAAHLLVTDPTGAQVPGTVGVDGATLTFTPTDPMATGTVHDVFVLHACGQESWSFTTRSPGGPVDPALLGRVYAADLATATWLAPAGIGPLVGAVVDLRTWWLTAVEVAPGVAELVAAPVQAGAQDLCAPTTRLPVDSWQPGLPTAAGPLDFTVAEVYGFPVLELRDLLGTGAPAADGTAVLDATASWWVDTVPLVDLVAPGGPDDAVCGLIAAFGVSCITCPDGSSDWCVEASLDLGDLPELPGASVVERDAATIAADPACP